MTFGKVNGAKIDRIFFFFLGGVLTFGKVNGAKIDLFFFKGTKLNEKSVPKQTVLPGGGGGFRSKSR